MRAAAVWSVVAVAVVAPGCASSSGGTQSGRADGTLSVRVGMFGGPMMPDGQMAASNRPMTGATFTVRDRAGHSWRATTGADGTASLSLAPGGYTVHSSCQTTTVVVRSGQTTRANLHCDVP